MIEQSVAGEAMRFVGGDGLICDHVICRGCGYDLMGLPSGGVCPECGKVIEESRLEAVAREDGLKRVVDAGWWGEVETGACILECTAFMRLVFMIGGGKASGEMLLGMVFVGLIGCYGWRVITKVRPGFEGVADVEFGRVRARWAGMAAELLVAVMWVPIKALESDVGRVAVVGLAGMAVWWGARELYGYWPRVIGEVFARYQGKWGVCYMGVCMGLAGVVAATGVGQFWAEAEDWLLGASVVGGGGCYLYSLLILALAGWEAQRSARESG